ncbi:V-SNARE coiled-coil-like proteiny domain-containing protein [Aphelenchoides besseyi]|nr:V-SNARE coiled-coil-like proteiny domain-containing protein [Aphelenchoides besseyi]KAI6212215.1 V-SNARE coiled-coil-like proteiny domain-containing protein [Aphelenchoides besseyi]
MIYKIILTRIDDESRIRPLAEATSSDEDAGSSEFSAIVHQLPATLDICTLVEQHLDKFIHRQLYSISLNQRCDLHGVVYDEPPHKLGYLCICDKGLELKNVAQFFDGIHTSYVSHASVIPFLLEPNVDELQNRLREPLLQSTANFNRKMDPQHKQRVSDLQQEVEQVKGVMSENVMRVMERGERLDNLDTRAAALQQSSETFRTTARRVQRNFCLKNLKWTIILGIFITVLIIIGVYLILRTAGVFK